jgi:peptide/nickel transport system substrate-binding protein
LNPLISQFNKLPAHGKNIKEEMVKKIIVPLAILLVVIFVITGCSSGTTTTAPTTSAPAVTQPGSTTPATSVAPAPSTSKPIANTVPPPTTTSAAGSIKKGGTLTWIANSGPAGPIGNVPEVTGPSGVTPAIMFDTLLKEYLDGSIKGWLAESYSVVTDANNASVTFKLQKGVKFHDGSDFNAKAVKWNLDRIKETPTYAGTTAAWKSIEMLDDYTIKVSFTYWANQLIRSFCDTMTYMQSPTAFEKNGLEWARYNIVGTGPFVQSQWQRDVTLAGTKNPNYWVKGMPYLDAIKYLFVTDNMTAVALFKSGGGDVVQTSNPPDLKDLSAKGYSVISVALGPVTLVPDGANADSPWSNLKVRQAAAYAIDNAALASTFGFGLKPAYQFSTPASMAFDSNIKGYPYDPAKAKQLLTEAGYPNGFKTTIIAGPIFLNQDAVVSVQAYLAKIGIQCTLQFPAMSQWSDINTKPWKNALLWVPINEWGNQNATFNYFHGTPPIQEPSQYQPPEWKALLDKSKQTAAPDPALLKQLEKLHSDNLMSIPLYYNSNNFVFQNYVMDHGEGTRGQSNWYEPQQTWLNK